MNCGRLCGLAVLLAAALLTGAAAVRAAGSGEPTAAFLDISRKPIGALVEQRLLECRKAVWLERTEIEEILQERTISSLFGPAACSERAEVGRILKADLLILLQHVAEPAEYAKLVVCETAGGLRLASHSVPLSEKTVQNAEQLAALAVEGIGKHGEKVREICAVPPFISQDLSYEYDHLKSAYAKLIEQTVRDRPGLLTVELEEAQAIGKELRLTGGKIRRALPLYVLGEFRHKSRGDDRTLAVRLRVMRGEQMLDERSAEGLPPDEATQFVKRATGELIEKTVGLRQSQPDAKLEAEQLAKRAEAFHRVGEWPEAAALAEASLLLDDKSSRMRRVAASAFVKLAHSDTANLSDNRPDRVERGLRRYLRALEHLEQFLPEVQDLSVDRLYRDLYFSVNWGNLFNIHNRAPEIRRLAGELRKQELQILLRMILARSRASAGDEYRLVARALRFRPKDEQFDILLRIVSAIQGLPGAAGRVKRITLRGYWIGLVLDNPEGRRYLERLKGIANAEVRQAAFDMEQSLERALAARSQQPSKKTEAVRDDRAVQKVRFEPIHLEPEYKGRRRKFRARGWLPAEPGTDLIWTSHVYVMKELGRPKEVWAADGQAGIYDTITNFGFDGRFAWFTTHNLRAKPRLFVLDPRTERVFEVGHEAGLPLVPTESISDRTIVQKLWVELIEPGRAMLVCWFGRMSISVVEFVPPEKVKVRTFFEARVSRDPSKEDAWRNVEMAFAPDHIFGFHGMSSDGKPIHRVVVGGRCPDHYLDYPLVVDPDSDEVKVASQPWTRRRLFRFPDREPDALYEVQLRDLRLHLVRVGLPDVRTQILLSDVPEGACLKRGDKYVIAGTKWWLVDPAASEDDRIRVLATQFPWVYRNSTGAGARFVGTTFSPPNQKDVFLVALFQSNHYGTIAVSKAPYYDVHGMNFYRVVFEDADLR